MGSIGQQKDMPVQLAIVLAEVTGFPVLLPMRNCGRVLLHAEARYVEGNDASE